MFSEAVIKNQLSKNNKIKSENMKILIDSAKFSQSVFVSSKLV